MIKNLDSLKNEFAPEEIKESSSGKPSISTDKFHLNRPKQPREIKHLFHTQMVLLKKSREKKNGTFTSGKDGTILLEIMSNCEWIDVRGKVLSLVSNLLGCNEYPKICKFPVGTFWVEILPKSDRMTEIPKHLCSTHVTAFLQAIRLRVTSAQTRTTYIPGTIQPTGMSGLTQFKLSLPGLPKPIASTTAEVLAPSKKMLSTHLPQAYIFGPFGRFDSLRVAQKEVAQNDLDSSQLQMQVSPESEANSAAICANKIDCNKNVKALESLLATNSDVAATKLSVSKSLPVTNKSSIVNATNKLSLSAAIQNNGTDSIADKTPSVIERPDDEEQLDNMLVQDSSLSFITTNGVKENVTTLSATSAVCSSSDASTTEPFNKKDGVMNYPFVNAANVLAVPWLFSELSSSGLSAIASTVSTPSSTTNVIVPACTNASDTAQYAPPTIAAACTEAVFKAAPILFSQKVSDCGSRTVYVPVTFSSLGSHLLVPPLADSQKSTCASEVVTTRTKTTASHTVNIPQLLSLPSGHGGRPLVTSLVGSNFSHLRSLVPVSRITASPSRTSDIRRSTIATGGTPLAPKFWQIIRFKSAASNPNKAATCNKDGDVHSKPMFDINNRLPAPIIYTSTPVNLNITSSNPVLSSREGKSFCVIGPAGVSIMLHDHSHH